MCREAHGYLDVVLGVAKASTLFRGGICLPQQVITVTLAVHTLPRRHPRPVCLLPDVLLSTSSFPKVNVIIKAVEFVGIPHLFPLAVKQGRNCRQVRLERESAIQTARMNTHLESTMDCTPLVVPHGALKKRVTSQPILIRIPITPLVQVFDKAHREEEAKVLA